MNRFPHLCLLAAALLSASGCLSFNVGRPEVNTVAVKYSSSEKVLSRSLSEVRAAHSVEADPSSRINRVSISLSGTFAKTYQPYQRVMRFETQRRMSFGLWPCFAEAIWKPSGSTAGGVNRAAYVYNARKNNITPAISPWWSMDIPDGQPEVIACAGPIWLLTGAMYTVFSSVLVPYTTLVVPFYGSYDGLQNSGGDTVYGFVPFGFHRYRTTRIANPPEQVEKVGGPRACDETIPAKGPYRVWLNVPGLPYSRTNAVERWESQAAFDLPMGMEDQTVSATVVFLPPDNDGEKRELTSDSRAILERASPAPHSLRIDLKGAPPVIRPPNSPSLRDQPSQFHAQRQTAACVTVTNVIVEKIVLPATKAPYDITTTQPYANGHAEFLVTLKDETKTKPEIADLARRELERDLRDAFLSENPGADVSTLRVYVLPTYDEGPTITFRGVAVSVEPVPGGWSYDSESRQGTFQLRILSRMDAKTAKEWAARNIDGIVADKGVAVEAGKRPPPGAKYKVVSDEMKDGVLFIRFKVVN